MEKNHSEAEEGVTDATNLLSFIKAAGLSHRGHKYIIFIKPAGLSQISHKPIIFIKPAGLSQRCHKPIIFIKAAVCLKYATSTNLVSL